MIVYVLSVYIGVLVVGLALLKRKFGLLLVVCWGKKFSTRTCQRVKIFQKIVQICLKTITNCSGYYVSVEGNRYVFVTPKRNTSSPTSTETFF